MRHRFEWQVASGAITKGRSRSRAKHRSLELSDWNTTTRQRQIRDEIQREECRQRFHVANLQLLARRSQVMRRGRAARVNRGTSRLLRISH
jgi:hypothetical protein